MAVSKKAPAKKTTSVNKKNVKATKATTRKAIPKKSTSKAAKKITKQPMKKGVKRK